FRGEALAEAILNAAPDIRTEPVLLPRALEAREILPEMLRARGATIDVVPAYRSLEPTAEARAELRGLVEDRAVDIVTFTASSTVTNLLGVLGDDAASLLSRLTVAAIGPITAATAERAGVRVDVTAEEYTIDGLVAALTTYYQTRAS
ncbi:MAG: uroporphyrinogen-III synthase, partial [Myxococcota bacterium]